MFRQRFLEYDFSKKTIFFEARSLSVIVRWASAGFYHYEKMTLVSFMSLQEAISFSLSLRGRERKANSPVDFCNEGACGSRNGR